MTDLSTDIAATGDAPTANLIKFALKNGAGEIEIDADALPIEVYREALLQGLKVLTERNMSKLTKAAYPDEADRKAKIKEVAELNVKDMYAGKVKLTGATKAKKASGAVMTEAMRLARNLVKDAMKANKIKISHVKASEITSAAKALLDADPSIIATAEVNLKAREATPVKINIAALIHTDPELVRKDAEKQAKAKAEKPISAKQAGKVAPRAKGAKPKAEAAHA